MNVKQAFNSVGLWHDFLSRSYGDPYREADPFTLMRPDTIQACPALYRRFTEHSMLYRVGIYRQEWTGETPPIDGVYTNDSRLVYGIFIKDCTVTDNPEVYNVSLYFFDTYAQAAVCFWLHRRTTYHTELTFTRATRYKEYPMMVFFDIAQYAPEGFENSFMDLMANAQEQFEETRPF